MSNEGYHVPVLLEQSVRGLAIKSDGVYVDVTYGGGGHSSEILKSITEGKLVAFDQDKDAAENVKQDERFIFVRHNFSFLNNYLRMHGISQVDGVLADLGVSSHQFDLTERGFSIHGDALLDMRMNQDAERSAFDVVNGYSETDLRNVFYQYAEIKNAGKLTDLIVRRRLEKKLKYTSELREVAWKCAPMRKEHQYLAKVFQALRIEVNDEMGVLKSMLEQARDVLAPGGRLVVISYHSLEDRLVKNFMKKGKFSGELEKDFYGNAIKPFDEITRKVVVPSDEEIERNSRARSAKMRIAEKR